MAKKEKNNIKPAESESFDTLVVKSIDDTETTQFVGMKQPDPTSHSNLASIPDTDEVEQRQIQFEKQEKKRHLGLRKRDDDEDDEDNAIISQELIEQSSRSNKAIRFDAPLDYGLNESQVEQRIREGLVNDNQKQYSKTYKQIFFNNIFTFFNVLCIVVAAALVYVKEYKNLTFLIILTINTIIGIVQEIKAKKTIDKLSIVTAPTTTVIRDSLVREIQVKELVLDDLVKLKNGKQISADCIVAEGDIEVNESLLTGESVAVKKQVGDSLYAGSFVTAGSCIAKVNRVGQDCYIQRLQAKAKRYSKPKSELLRSLKLITTFIAIMIIPLGSIIAYRNYESAQASVLNPTFGTTGSLVVYGVTTNGDVKLGQIENVAEVTDTSISIDFLDGSSNINQIKILYDDKVNGNISISKIAVYGASKVEDSEEYTIDTTKNLYEFNAVEGSSIEDYSFPLKFASTYLDGTIKLDETGSYITSNYFESTDRICVRLVMQSRGYGYDNTPEEQETIQTQTIRVTITKTAGSLVGMIPTGLFLLVTVALAASVVKLANSKTLVQELYCIEMLARVDCICLDKTGTITDGTMKVKEIIEIDPPGAKDPQIETIIGAILGALDDNNFTSIALKEKFGVNFEFKKVATLPFSSARKLSAVTFEGEGTYVMGAPEFVYNGKAKKISTLVAKKAAMGYRVLMLAHSDKSIENEKIPSNCNPIALITLEDHIRDEAYETISWFKENGVQVKVISGDNPATVAEIAAKAGVDGASDYISLEGLSTQEVETIATEYTVFGRVSPDQKALLIRTLKRHGKTVAMTGDGVNDILAMKESDCSVAMASGSDAARNVAHLVLLDSNFANMPKVVLEGRRAINNIQSSASLYLMKTLFVMAITLLSIFAKTIFSNGYPFEPIQFLLLEFFIIGAPSTFLALQPNKEKIHGNFLANIFSNCIVQALCLVATVLSLFIISGKDINGLNLSNIEEVTSMSVIAVTYVGFIILANVCKPLNTLRFVICVVSFICITVSILNPGIASALGISVLFTNMQTSNKLLLLVIILAVIPLETGLTDIIRTIKYSDKHNVSKEGER